MSADEVPRPDAEQDDEQHPVGSRGLQISNAIVRLLRSHAGRGPTKAKTTITAELAVVTLRECLTVAEKSLADNGHKRHVKDGRHALHEGIRAEAISVVEAVTGRRVAAYLTDQHHHPDIAVIVFVFERPSTLTAA